MRNHVFLLCNTAGSRGPVNLQVELQDQPLSLNELDFSMIKNVPASSVRAKCTDSVGSDRTVYPKILTDKVGKRVM